MEVMFGLPGDLECRIAQIDLHTSEIIGSRGTKISPIFFSLSEHHCLRLMAGDLVLVDLSKMGYLYSKTRDFTAVSPTANDTYIDASEVPNDRDPGKAHQRWAFFKEGSMTLCHVKKNMIYIRMSELAKFTQAQTLNLYRYRPHHLPDDSQFQSILHESISDKLELMNRASSRFWFQKAIIRGDNRTYPKTEEIEAWFVQHGFSKTAAISATQFIRPEFAGLGRTKISDN